MKHLQVLFFALILSIPATCGAADVAVNVIPVPKAASLADGKPFVISTGLSYAIDGLTPDESRPIVDALQAIFPGVHLAAEGSSPAISLRMDNALTVGDEGYTLSVDSAAINIAAASAGGVFYALQTLRQMADATDGSIPAVKVTDAPRFAYRGLMIDVSRHFRDKEFIKKQIDAMARLKLNRLHLHLTDGAGWRIESVRYPRLTGLAAWRRGNTWKEWDHTYCSASDPDARGGYYTKDDLREIVQYAADRFITVIPEIEMPSHSEEVIAAYPELSCSGEMYGSSDLCIGNEATFTFLTGILDEVMEIFPSEYIHIGGDEAGKQAWRTCEKCLRRMEMENLDGVDGLQSYLIHRIGDYVASKGRKIIGWDEIMEGGIAPGAAVMAWRGTEAAVKAAAAGHDAIMVPGRYCYLDAYQDAPCSQPEAIGGYLPLAAVYAFDAAPDSLDETVRNHILGLQGALFTEYVPTASHAEYMLYPRVFAIAERAWAPVGSREYADFRDNAVALADRLRSEGYNTFDLRGEIGNRQEYLTPVDHLARDKKVIYNNQGYSPRYPAAGESTLTDGLRGGWTYSDGRWQGFCDPAVDPVMDITVDLDSLTPVEYIGLDFMQICGPDVWFPEKVVISVSADGSEFSDLTVIDNPPVADDNVSFRTFSWSGKTMARYVRCQAHTPGHFLFTDEIIIR